MASIPRFVHHSPRDLAAALALMAEYGSGARALAGGTDLIRQLKARKLSVDHVVSLNRIESLKAVRWDDGRGLSVAAGVRISHVANHPDVQKYYPALAYACNAMATPQIRNMATMVGNVANGSPCADTACPLICYDAVVVVAGLKAERRIPITDFFLGPGSVDLREGELVSAIELPRPEPGMTSTYLRLSARSRVDIAAVSCGVSLKLDTSGQVESVRLALGAVAPTPLRLFEAERLIQGKVLDDVAHEQAVIEGAKAAAPIDDVRASAAYRKAMVPVLLRRALARCRATLRGRAP